MGYKGQKMSLEVRQRMSVARRQPKPKVVCQLCSTVYEVHLYKLGQTRFCSRKCQGDSLKGKAPWNKGLKGMTEEKAYQWKGDKVGYSALHRWVRNKLGSADHCEDCGLNKLPTGKKMYFDWANISQRYIRSLDDWKQLCKKCHKAFDGLARLTVKQ